MLVLNLPFKALMFLTLMRPSLVLFLVLWLKLVKDFLKVRCRLAPETKLGTASSGLGTLEPRSEERFSRNAETDLVCRLLLEKKKYEAESVGAQKYGGHDQAWQRRRFYPRDSENDVQRTCEGRYS